MKVSNFKDKVIQDDIWETLGFDNIILENKKIKFSEAIEKCSRDESQLWDFSHNLLSNLDQFIRDMYMINTEIIDLSNNRLTFIDWKLLIQLLQKCHIVMYNNFSWESELETEMLTLEKTSPKLFNKLIWLPESDLDISNPKLYLFKNQEEIIRNHKEFYEKYNFLKSN